MTNKLYVGGLSYSTDENGLQNAFAEAGNVTSVSIIQDKMTGRSRGFGFVEMATPEEAQAAISMWNGNELDGRKLTVNEAKPKEDKPRSGGFNRSGGNNFNRNNKRW